jgi:predicted alpha/beta-hydrolase family hydrolase
MSSPSRAEPATALTVRVDSEHAVSALLDTPRERPRAVFVFAHGAGAGMTHPFMAAVARALVDREVATLRYQFPYMEQRAKRPDRPPLAHATVRAAVEAAAAHLSGVPLIAGGKSFGGRMTSQAQAQAPLPGVAGLAFLGFPLHPPGKPADERAAHLADVHVPMLFLQGSRDELADLTLLRPVVTRLASRATLEVLADADHSFHVRARSGRGDAEVRADVVDRFVAWIDRVT